MLVSASLPWLYEGQVVGQSSGGEVWWTGSLVGTGGVVGGVKCVVGDGRGDVDLGWLLRVAVAGPTVSLTGVRRTPIMVA